MTFRTISQKLRLGILATLCVQVRWHALKARISFRNIASSSLLGAVWAPYLTEGLSIVNSTVD